MNCLDTCPATADWITHLVAEPYDKSGEETQRQPRKEGVAELTTLFERVQQWREERDLECLLDAIGGAFTVRSGLEHSESPG